MICFQSAAAEIFHPWGVDLDLGPQQMLPLIPGGVPLGMQESGIEPQFELAAHIPA
jgi:hypothetical protein